VTLAQSLKLFAPHLLSLEWAITTLWMQCPPQNLCPCLLLFSFVLEYRSYRILKFHCNP